MISPFKTWPYKTVGAFDVVVKSKGLFLNCLLSVDHTHQKNPYKSRRCSQDVYRNMFTNIMHVACVRMTFMASQHMASCLALSVHMYV